MNSPNLAMPLLAVGQASKETTHNEALAVVDALLNGAVLAADVAAPPGTPADGQAWIIPAGATGAWAGRAGQMAAWYGGWRFLLPKTGWSITDLSNGRRLHYTGTAWTSGGVDQLPSLSLDWIGFGGGYATPRYRRSADGRVSLEGMMQSGADGVVFTLLPGFRPAARLVFACWGAGGAYRVDVLPNGDVQVQGSNTVFASLAGVGFQAA